MLKTYCFQYKFNVANKGLDKNCAITICERRLQRSRVRFSLTTNKLGLPWNPNAYSLLPNTVLIANKKWQKGFLVMPTHRHYTCTGTNLCINFIFVWGNCRFQQKACASIIMGQRPSLTAQQGQQPLKKPNRAAATERTAHTQA